jgi:hypothetical protein
LFVLLLNRCKQMLPCSPPREYNISSKGEVSASKNGSKISEEEAVWHDEIGTSAPHASSVHNGQSSAQVSSAASQVSGLPAMKTAIQPPSSVSSAISLAQSMFLEGALLNIYPGGNIVVGNKDHPQLQGNATPSQTQKKSSFERAISSVAEAYAPRGTSRQMNKLSLDEQQPSGIARLCQTLYMHRDAAAGWCMISETPRAALVIFFICSALTIVGFGSIYTLGVVRSRWYPYVLLFPALYLPLDVLFFFMFWRYGPYFARTKFFSFAHPGCLIGSLSPAVISYVATDFVDPFGSKLLHTAALFATIFVVNVAAKLGRVPDEHPPQPYPMLRSPVLDAGVRTMRTMDALTDMSIIHQLVEKVLLCCL